MDIFKIFTPSYLLEIQPPADSPLLWFFIILFGVLILSGFSVLLYLKMIKGDEILGRVLRFIPARFISYGIGGFVFLFFRDQRAPYLSMRIWLFAYTLWVFYVIYTSMRDARKDYANRKSMRDEREKIKADNYLPQQKTKRRKKRKR